MDFFCSAHDGRWMEHVTPPLFYDVVHEGTTRLAQWVEAADCIEEQKKRNSPCRTNARRPRFHDHSHNSLPRWTRRPLFPSKIPDPVVFPLFQAVFVARLYHHAPIGRGALFIDSIRRLSRSSTLQKPVPLPLPCHSRVSHSDSFTRRKANAESLSSHPPQHCAI